MKELFKLFVIIAMIFMLSSNSFSLPVTVNGSVSLDYPDLTSAFDAINLGTHGSGAISVLINESHTLTSAATLNGGVFTSCEIKPTADVTVDGNFPGSLIVFDGADRVTIDGRIGVENFIKLTLANSTDCIEMKNGATDNVIKFIQTNSDINYSFNIHILQSLPGTGGNNNNSIEDSHTGGIYSQGTDGASGYTNGGTKILRNNCGGIELDQETRDPEIKNNKCEWIDVRGVGVINIMDNKSGGIRIAPIILTAPGSNITEINMINNFVTVKANLDFCFCSYFIYGIRVITYSSFPDINANVYYNSVFLYGSAAFGVDLLSFGIAMEIRPPGSFNLKNNLVINALGNSLNAYSLGSLINAAGITANADYNCYINLANTLQSQWNNTIATDITDYRAAAFPNEQHTIFKYAQFENVFTGDLHLAGASIMDEELQGIQIPGITTDIDGQLRNSPFMGADEADYLLPVELTSFISSVNGNNVQLNWTTASETNNSGFDLERSDVKGQTSDEWNKIGFIQGKGTTAVPNNYVFTDNGLNAGKYKYRLKQIDFNGNYEYYNLSNEVVIGVPDKYSLSQNFPNPFNPTTNLEFGISNLEFVSLKVYDVIGKEVQVLVNEQLSPGSYEVKFDGSNLSSGVYFYKLTAGNFSAVKKMFLMK